MSNACFEDEVYEGKDYTTEPLPKGAYEGCTFINCNLSNTDLGNIRFTECTFKGCNLSNARVPKTTLNDVVFKECKILGINFENCDTYLFSVSFDHCVLNYSSFYKRLLKKTPFVHCTIHEADFTDCDLTQSSFDHCDLTNTKFENTNLEKADFRSAMNYTIDPDLNKIKKAQFSLPAVVGLLQKYDIVIK